MNYMVTQVLRVEFEDKYIFFLEVYNNNPSKLNQFRTPLIEESA